MYCYCMIDSDANKHFANYVVRPLPWELVDSLPRGASVYVLKKLRVSERLRVRDENSVDIIFQGDVRFSAIASRGRRTSRGRRVGHAYACIHARVTLLRVCARARAPDAGRTNASKAREVDQNFGGTCTHTLLRARIHAASCTHAFVIDWYAR